jgi:hypothetical protein
MKSLLLSLLFLGISTICFSQNDTIVLKDTNTYRIIKNDGGEIIAKILSKDEREILVLTTENRKFYIPQHVIKTIVLIEKSDLNSKGEYIGEDNFATRYFITTNGLPIKKGEHYIQWNLFGPDFQFGIGKDFGIGIMSSWIGMPIIGSIKKSWELGDKTQFALGGLIGTGTWIAPDFGGALPFGTLSFGDRTKNIAFSSGYGAIWNDGKTEGRTLASIAGMIKISPKFSFVFDSFILLPKQTTNSDYQNYGYIELNSKKPGLAIFIPGLRWHQEIGKAIQFGFTALFTDNEFKPIPIPMVQWYRSL